jgi:methylmalonyl-CoA mutase N-terminal domain/subunit
MIENGEIKVVGRNYHRDPDLKMPDVWVHEYDEDIARRMRDKLAALRKQRDNEKVNSCLTALKEACRRGDNVMAYTLECARADVTEGEMRRAFIEAFGSWKPPIYG